MLFTHIQMVSNDLDLFPSRSTMAGHYGQLECPFIQKKSDADNALRSKMSE
jgi:hypothetical protein